MAHTQAGRELTEANRVAQATITAKVVEAIRELFLDIIDLDDLDGSSTTFVRQALPVVMAGRSLAYDTATEYLESFRRVELRGLIDHSSLAPEDNDRYAVDMDVLKTYTDPAAVVDWGGDDPADDLVPPRTVATDLHTSGAAVAKAHIAKGTAPAEAKEKAANAVAAKVIRHVADGGRAPLAAEVRTGNRGAVGYARVVDADPCPFCAMLASRGAVYRSDAFAGSNALFAGDGAFKVHDGCECTLEPVYGRSATSLPPGSATLAKEWAEIAAGRDDPFAYWRRYKESGTLPGEERGNADTESRRPSARQYGREKARAAGKRKGRKQIADIDSKAELEKTLKGMYVRRAGLERELAELESRGQLPNQPGPAQAIAAQLKRLNRNIDHANRRLGTM